jgi:DNA mismatch repair ATPase MutS
MWLLITLQITGSIEGGWWTIPMMVGIVLSFAFARRMYAVFDRASMGQRALDRYSAMLTLACQARWSAPELARLQAELRLGGDAPRLVKQLSRLAEWSELRTAAAILHFPIQALTLWDFHVFFAIERWHRAHGTQVGPWLAALGNIDALSVLSAIRHDYPEWATPAIGTSDRTLAAVALGHPLIRDDRRVTNDVEVGPQGTLLLVTGSNMSGKSTLLRAIGLNAVLAQAGAPVCATSFAMPSCDVQTSIRVQDSLERGLSYFMAALARLKAIVDAAETARPDDRTLLYLLDEVLQGTNSAERAVAVRAVARHLLDAGAIGAMTTHDLAVAQEEPFASHARMVHFSEQVHEDGTMTFDYRLRPGLATSRNALRLMQLIGIAPK